MSSGAPENTNNNAEVPATEAPKKSKKELAKEAKKDKKNAFKAANAEKQGKAAEEEESSPNCGDIPVIKSAEKLAKQRVFIDVEHLDESKAEQTVLIRARVYNSRSKGNLCFVVLRQRGFTVQGVLAKNEHVNKAMLKFVATVPRESVVDVEGVVKKAAVELCSQNTIELQVQKFFVVSRAEGQLPLMIEDAARPQHILDAQAKEVADIEAQIKAAEEGGDAKKVEELQKKKAEASKFVIASQDVRLDNRILDLRTPANHSIFRIQSEMCALFRELLGKQGFVEIHTPKIMGSASEGGAEVFKIGYFIPEATAPNAFLAQSPQLHKQMAVISDFEKVFEIGPVFRAENANTHRHMCEFMGLDLEMVFKDHYHEVLDVIGQLFTDIFKGIQSRCQKELSIINQQFSFQPLEFLEPTLRLNFKDGVAMLRAAGVEIEDLQDLNTEKEKVLGKLVKEKYHTDFFILDKFPKVARPFYTMPDPHDPNYTNAYDLFLRGEEISSGAQRIHDYNMLIDNIKAFGINPKTLEAYTNAFRFGSMPHAGCGVGLERLVMLYLGLNNIRKTSMFPRTPTRLLP